MTAKSRQKTDMREDLINRYMNYVLEQGHPPGNIYKFCKEGKIKEEEFYAHFGSFKGLQQAVWEAFYNNTIELLQKNKEYNDFNSKDKLLSFFYTFFELLTANRSYVLISSDHGGLKDKSSEYKTLRKKIRSFAEDLIAADNEEKSSNLLERNTKIFAEGAWWHFMFLFKFWVDDNSPGFEKTDMAIEKSVNTVYDLFDNTPLENILDFGKFLVKEGLS